MTVLPNIEAGAPVTVAHDPAYVSASGEYVDGAVIVCIGLTGLRLSYDVALRLREAIDEAFPNNLMLIMEETLARACERNKQNGLAPKGAGLRLVGTSREGRIS